MFLIVYIPFSLYARYWYFHELVGIDKNDVEDLFELKGTGKEVAALEPILKTAGVQASASKGFAATEESFKAMGAGSNSHASCTSLQEMRERFINPYQWAGFVLVE